MRHRIFIYKFSHKIAILQIEFNPNFSHLPRTHPFYYYLHITKSINPFDSWKSFLTIFSQIAFFMLSYKLYFQLLSASQQRVTMLKKTNIIQYDMYFISWTRIDIKCLRKCVFSKWLLGGSGGSGIQSRKRKKKTGQL